MYVYYCWTINNFLVGIQVFTVPRRWILHLGDGLYFPVMLPRGWQWRFSSQTAGTHIGTTIFHPRSFSWTLVQHSGYIPNSCETMDTQLCTPYAYATLDFLQLQQSGFYLSLKPCRSNVYSASPVSQTVFCHLNGDCQDLWQRQRTRRHCSILKNAWYVVWLYGLICRKH